MSRPKLSPAQRAHRHATRRAWQRFGLAVSEPELKVAEQRIWNGAAEWLADLKPMRQAYRVKLRHGDPKRVIVVFDIHIEAIVTCLPDGAKLYRVARAA